MSALGQKQTLRSSHARPLCAMCGRLLVGKGFLHVCSLGRCSHVFGLFVRHTGPQAILPSADQVPIRSTHLTMRWYKWLS